MSKYLFSRSIGVEAGHFPQPFMPQKPRGSYVKFLERGETTHAKISFNQCSCG